MKEQKLGPGISIQGFDSLEEMLQYQAEKEQEALHNTLPEQAAITWGDYVFRMVDDLAIFGHIMTPAEYLSDTIGSDEPDEATVSEIEGEMKGLERSHVHGYRYGKWFSEVEPTGEYGSAHVVALWGITQEDFEQAERNGWRIWPELGLRIVRETRVAKARHDNTMKGKETQ